MIKNSNLAFNQTTMQKILFSIILLLIYACSGPSPKKDSTKAEIQEQKQNPVENKEKEPELIVHASKFRILPIDQSSEDPSLKLFVSKLKRIVRQKNLNEFISYLDTGIVSSYGGGEYGIPTFKTTWGLNENHQESGIWKLLDTYISMGGAWDDAKKERFCFPYVQSNLIHSTLKLDLDCYFMVTCIKPQVIIYKEATIHSKKIGILSYEIVRATNVSGEFTQIETIDQTISGYVSTNNLIHCASANPVLEKISGEWKITSFAPYD